jgi:hypothetical protein
MRWCQERRWICTWEEEGKAHITLTWLSVVAVEPAARSTRDKLAKLSLVVVVVAHILGLPEVAGLHRH